MTEDLEARMPGPLDAGERHHVAAGDLPDGDVGRRGPARDVGLRRLQGRNPRAGESGGGCVLQEQADQKARSDHELIARTMPSQILLVTRSLTWETVAVLAWSMKRCFRPGPARWA